MAASIGLQTYIDAPGSGVSPLALTQRRISLCSLERTRDLAILAIRKLALLTK